ncbi:hypothetical protein EST38_g12671 [Candolleomyces aberdarensis]|uniref:Uncharacterized protein n=1 Tax=Candolleomyces aberdarensis TaxID=2316362 RepID=A0A4Q2D4C3_9AGAR|nr:hypothetical protein EST38_g12671 [Candolleomyces aberdarensis]
MPTHSFMHVVLGIYHAYVSYAGEFPVGSWDLNSVRLEFLWVRWYDLLDPDPNCPTPLDRLSFPSVTSLNATSFIDPSAVLRAVHLIPRFRLGRVHEDGQGQSDMAGDWSDWKEYFVNRFIDRDMFMRYQISMAVGHLPQQISEVPAVTRHQGDDQSDNDDEGETDGEEDGVDGKEDGVDGKEDGVDVKEDGDGKEDVVMFGY